MTQNIEQLALYKDPAVESNSQTTAQELNALIGSARDIMRKDKGLIVLQC